MSILSALSILAFAALLWAALAIAGAVRRAKRRRQRRAFGEAGVNSGAPSTASNISGTIFYADPVAATEVSIPGTIPPPPPLPAPHAPRLRNFPSRLGKHPVAAFRPEGTETGWNPFGTVNKDFADLTDPAPGGRRREQPRSRRSELSDPSDPSDPINSLDRTRGTDRTD